MSHTCPQCGGLIGHNAQKVANTLQMAGQRTFVCQGHPDLEPRERKFIGFAALLAEEINGFASLFGGDEDLQHDIERIVTRRAYDLVSHVLNNTGPYMIECLTHEEQIAEIPDMTAWPEEGKG